MLLRFTGLRLANGEDLVPVHLRRGDRDLDGAMSSARPLPRSTSSRDRPLARAPVAGDVVVHRQVLAPPGRSWHRAPGRASPTAPPLDHQRVQGEGWLVLVRTTANPPGRPCRSRRFSWSLCGASWRWPRGRAAARRACLRRSRCSTLRAISGGRRPVTRPVAAADLAATPASPAPAACMGGSRAAKRRRARR